VFEKFYRVGRSETQGRRGSGVGLALVRHVAEAHGGTVTVQSAPGQGSRFTLWLPLGANIEGRHGSAGTARAVQGGMGGPFGAPHAG
jgi:signal transduction histidine kinase